MATTVAFLDFRSEQFLLFLIYKSPQCFLPRSKSIVLSVQEKKREIDIQDGGHFGFQIGTILTICDLQVTLMLPSEFQVSWLFGSGEKKRKRDFQDGRYRSHF